MRDIRPAQPMGGQRRDDEVPPEEVERASKTLYEATGDKAPRKEQPPAAAPKLLPRTTRSPKRFTGAAIPVTKIHVPEDTLSHSDADHVTQTKRAASRPLFAVPAPSARGRGGRGRVGPREQRLLFAFFGLVVVAAGIAALIFLPTAHILLTFRTAPLLVDQRLTIRADGTGSDAIPGTVFRREIHVSGDSPVTHREVVGEVAVGTVRIVNRTFETQSIKERSRLEAADGQLFYMTTHAIVPPAEDSTPSVVTVPVEAAEAGEAGNIEPQRLDFVSFDAGSRTVVYAESIETFTGGSGEEITVVSEEDLDGAQRAAREVARQQAEVEVRTELPEGWVLLSESWQEEPLLFETDAQVGDSIPSIAYDGRVVVQVIGYEQQALDTLLSQALEGQLDEEYMLFPGPISYTKMVDSLDWDNATADLVLRVTHTTIPRLSLDTLRAKLAGRTHQEAQEYLEGFPGVQSVTIDLWPFWVRSIPRIEKRIALDLEPERQP